MSLFGRVASLLGVSAYAAPSNDVPGVGPYRSGISVSLDDPRVIEARRRFGGALSPPSQTKTRWFDFDLEAAQYDAEGGDLSTAAMLMKAARTDGTFAGVLSTRTGGLVRLPKKFRGNSEIVRALELGHESVRSVFDEMFPPSELATLAADGLLLGVGVGELVPVEGRDYPVLVRLDPSFLQYRWSENRWYYISLVGPIAITPGDGRWVLHTPGGRLTPWQHGLWRAIGRAWLDKETARLHKANWEAKLANPARVAVSPQGAGQPQRDAWFQAVMAWGINTVFGMTPGYDVKLIESNGVGYQCFNTTIANSNTDMIIAIAGQVVTTDGGAGFANADIHKSIRSDLIKETADGLAYTLNTQGIPQFVISRFGEDALDESACVEWDVTPPKDKQADAQATATAANALSALTAALAPYQRTVDVKQFAVKFGIPILGDDDGDGDPDETVDADVESDPSGYVPDGQPAADATSTTVIGAAA